MAKHPKRPRDTNHLAKFIADMATGEIQDKTDDGKNPAAVALGRMGGLKGGKARAEKAYEEAAVGDRPEGGREALEGLGTSSSNSCCPPKRSVIFRS
jgi:hypothetical protein